jgi:hypothetical protein
LARLVVYRRKADTLLMIEIEIKAILETNIVIKNNMLFDIYFVI